MISNGEISFSASGFMLAFGAAALLAVVGAAWYAWQRSGYDRAVGCLELLRLVLALMAFVTLCQPEWTERFVPKETPVLAVLCDDSKSMDTRDVVDSSQVSTEPTSRREWLRAAFHGMPWDRLGDRVEVVRHNFGATPPVENEVQLRSGTDLNAALESAMKQHENLRSVLVLSDGDWNQGESPTNAATRLRLQNVPVYAAAVGSEEPLPDIEVASLEPPTFSVAGKSLQIPFSIRSRLATDYEAKVTLTIHAGREATGQTGQPLNRQTKQVVIPAMGVGRDVFFWTPSEVGDLRLTLDVEPHPAELLKENNRASVTVAVKAESLKVLVVESIPRWEYRYLRNALERDPGVQVSCLLLHPGLSKRGGGSGYLKTFPATDEELSQYDVIFLGDVGVGAGLLTEDECRRLKGMVESQASGLIFMPGMRGNQASLIESPLSDLYPVILDASAPKGFGSRLSSNIILTDQGKSSLLTKLADTARENEIVWRTLPGVQWRSSAVRARAGCDVLAIHQESRAPLLVTKTYGTGKILFMGTDGAWRWRQGVEDKYHYRFWGQVARWMAYQRHMAQGDMLRLFYSPDRPSAGNEVILNATVLDANGAPLKTANVLADLTEPNGATRSIRFAPAGDDWGLFTARFSPDQIGNHQLIVRCRETGASLDANINVQGQEREVIGKPARLDVLSEIAKITRGRLIDADSLDEVCELVMSLPPPQPTIRRKQLWASPLWAGTLLGTMLVFWIGRKWIGAI